MSRVLVTGGTGFLARHLLPKLGPAFALARTDASWTSLSFRHEWGDVVPIVGTLDDPTLWSPSPEQVSAIVHLAALVRHSRKNPEELYQANVEGTLAMVRLAARLQARLVFVSTSGTVGCFANAEQTADEDAPYCDQMVSGWPYYASKLRAEIAARALAQQLGVELVIVRLPVLLGPGDHRGRSTALVARLAAGRQRFVMEGGMAFADVRDAAAGLAVLTTTPAPRPIYHFAGTSCRLADFFRQCAELAGTKPPRFRLPKAAALPLAHLANGLAVVLARRSMLPDPVVVEMASRYWGFTSRWAHELGYTARPAQETLRDTIAWLRSNEKTSQGH
jgi:dihydroflavonol-4-reductase